MDEPVGFITKQLFLSDCWLMLVNRLKVHHWSYICHIDVKITALCSHTENVYALA